MNFKIFKVVILLTAAFVIVKSGDIATKCDADKCKIENNCRCSSSSSPINISETPQLVALTFDDAIVPQLYDNCSQFLFNKNNPDGIPVGATFFVPHENTDYQRVNDFYNYGFEIGVNSISKNSNQDYWRKASDEVLQQEFDGQRTIISKFANIPASDIIGVRTPQLQLAGNFSFKAFQNSKFVYDSSWSTRKSLFPYTLDYLSTQECDGGFECPNEQFKGFWESPIIDLTGDNGAPCSTLAGCRLNDSSVDYIYNWLFNEITKVRNSTRVPLTLIVELQWFQTTNSLPALDKAMTQLIALGDVFFVSQGQLINWIKNPVPISEFKTEYDDTRAASCTQARQCSYDLQTKIMNSCVACPNNYPWLGNPLGN